MPAQYDNRISLQKLEVFCLVVELGGMSRAADHLIVAQPVVTAHVQSLQQRLGVKLLYREGHRMRLTDAGERVYAWAAETLARTRELMRELDGLSEGQRGTVAVAASMTLGSYLLPGVLTEFRQRRPAAEITLSVSDPEHAIASVEMGECDFAVVVADALPNNPGLRSEVIGYEDILLVAAPDYDPGTTSLPVAALAETPLVSSPAGLVRRTIVDSRLAALGVNPRNVVIELGHPEAMKRAIHDGLGMCLMLRSSVARELHDGTLRQVSLEDAELSVPLMTVLRADKRPSPIQRELLDAVSMAIRQGAERAGPIVA
jgi:LysR family transcriptional regulator, low CO2-responsive transcriptional regulator